MLKFEDILESLKNRIIRVPPDDCWIWTGGKTQPGVSSIQKTRRDYNFFPEKVKVVVKPYGIFQYKKKRIYVHRFLAKAFKKQRMTNFCGNTLCVNPIHWISEIQSEDKLFFDPETEVADARCVIDGIGIARNLRLEDLLDHELLTDYSPEAIEKALEELR